MIPCNRCGVPVPQDRYSVVTDRMCPDCKRELLEYERNVPADDLDDEPETVCAWCQSERGETDMPGQSHGICERHRSVLSAQAAEISAQFSFNAPVDEPERICVNGHRAEQVLFSAAIVLVIALSFALGAGVASWRFAMP